MFYSIPLNFRRELAFCRDFDEAFELYTETMREFGFRSVSYSFCAWQTVPRLSDETWFQSCFPTDLNRAYHNHGAIDHDLSEATMQQSAVIDGQRVFKYPDCIIYVDMLYRAAQFGLMSDKTIELMELAAEEDVFDGFCIGLPTKSPSFAASGVIAPKWMTAKDLRDLMNNFGDVVMDVIFDFHAFCSQFKFPGPGQKLTLEQQRLAVELAQDKTIQQCADTLGVSDDSLYKRLERMRERVFVNTNHGLITKLQLQRQI